MDHIPNFSNAKHNKARKKTTFNRKLKFNIATKYCLAFCRTGHCLKGSKCLFAHDVDKISICKKFLYGKCKLVKCLLSHNLTPDKMPDCSFFLKGRCKVENCNYRHVKVREDAILCRDFLKGYCPKGLQCENSHLFLCKLFNKSGKCPKGPKCTLAHERVDSRNVPLKSDLSRYKKINNNNNLSIASKFDSKHSSNIEKPVHRAILNSLLAKRLETANQSNKQIVSQPNTGVESCSDFIPLSVNSDISNDFRMINQIISQKQNQSDRKYKTSSSQLSKRKYFVIDNDEEKLADYLSYDSRLSSESICRPQLKIIPDFLIS